MRGYITTLFADDSKCFHVVLGQDDGDKLQEDLNKLFELLHLWGMECNVKKCEVVRVACFKCIYEREYFLGNTCSCCKRSKYFDQLQFEPESLH